MKLRGCHILLTLALSVPFFTLTGCTQGVQGIFAELEAEVAIATNNLGDGNMQAMTRAMVDGTDSYVVIKGIAMFHRDVDGGQWQRLAPPSGFGMAQFLTTVTVGGEDHLYAVFGGEGGSISFTLRRREDGEWSEELFTASGFTRITGLAAEGTNLYVSATNDSSSTGTTHLFRSDRADPATPITGSGIAFPGDGGSTDRDLQKVLTAGGRTWIVGRQALFELDGKPLSLAAVATPDGVRDVELLDNDTLVAVTTGGGVFTAAAGDASNWTSRAQDGKRFTSVTKVRDGLIVVGSEASPSATSRGRGFMDGTVSGTGGGVTITLSNPRGNYRSTQMQVSSLNGFFVDDAGPNARLFVLTVAGDRGLYRADNYRVDDAVTWEME